MVGALTRRDLSPGELRDALAELSRKRWRSPGSDHTRTYGVSTLQRWFYRYRRDGIDALRPQPRRDRGRARELTDEQRKLLLDIRREYPHASATLIVRTLVTDGRLESGAVSPQTVRRLYVEAGLDRVHLRGGGGGKQRLRWQAERPGALWHGDVCHGSAILIDGKSRPVRIHALMDDVSRYVVALEAMHTEREIDMLGLFVRALRRHGPSDLLYLDNGSTYRGDRLRTACARLGVTLVHAQPYDAPARGKMERFWRTLREGCLDFVGSLTSLHDLNVRLWAYLDEHYHKAPHASLLGRSPAQVYEEGRTGAIDDLDEQKLRDALTVRVRRRVRRDSTLSVDGTEYEIDGAFLAGQMVTAARCLVDLTELPWVEHASKRFPLHRVDPTKNARRGRKDVEPKATGTPVDFDPPRALLDRAVGRRPRRGGGKGGAR
ncbi:MAG: transposase [Planctomycetes bacterium]|nr:transposase [Planctomycetota bacterium]